MRKAFALRLVGACVATSVLAFGTAGASQPTLRQADSSLSGVTLFRGIFLGTGPVADVVPSIAGVPGNFEPMIIELEPAVIAHVRNAAPSFFPRFGSALQSGDPTQVGRALERGTVLFRSALADELQLRDPDMAKVLRRLPSDRYRVGAIFGAVVIAVAAWLWVWFWTSNVPMPGDLTWEMLVRDITTEFATS